MEKKQFRLSAIGDTTKRTTLGPFTSVEIFRIVKISMSSIISSFLEEGKGNEFIYGSGAAVGEEIYRVMLSQHKDLNEFITELKQLLINLKIGVISIVSADIEKGKIDIRVDECVSCSGTPNIGIPVCHFEGGLIAGVLKGFTGKKVEVKEFKCWGLGDNFCEFDVTIM